MKKFRVIGTSIKEFEIVKETGKQIVYRVDKGYERRDSKCSTYCSWHDTKEGAINHIISDKQTEINGLLSRIEYLKSQIEQIEKLK